jgi:hypothetical protein
VPATGHRRHPRRASRRRSLCRPVGHRTLHDAQRSDHEETSGTGSDRGRRQRQLEQGTCSTILLPLFHHPVSERSRSDGAFEREPSGLVVVRSRSGTWSCEGATRELWLEAELVIRSARSLCDQAVCRPR